MEIADILARRDHRRRSRPPLHLLQHAHRPPVRVHPAHLAEQPQVRRALRRRRPAWPAIAAARASKPGGTFTVQAEPVRTRVTGMPRFSHVRGGGYFFMPGHPCRSLPRVIADDRHAGSDAIIERLRPWAPLPLRVALGVGLMIHGGIKLFVPGGHENIAHMVGSWACPFRTRWDGSWAPSSSSAAWASCSGACFRVRRAERSERRRPAGPRRSGRRIPDPLPGGDPLPAFREAFLILAGTLDVFSRRTRAVGAWMRARPTCDVGRQRKSAAVSRA